MHPSKKVMPSEQPAGTRFEFRRLCELWRAKKGGITLVLSKSALSLLIEPRFCFIGCRAHLDVIVAIVKLKEILLTRNRFEWCRRMWKVGMMGLQNVWNWFGRLLPTAQGTHGIPWSIERSCCTSLCSDRDCRQLNPCHSFTEDRNLTLSNYRKSATKPAS